MSEVAGDAMKLRLKLKLPRSMSVSSVAEEAQKKLLIGARGGVVVKELLSTAPNIEVAIRDFQAAHGVANAHAQLFVRKKEKETPTTFSPAVLLLDLLQMPRSSVYQSLLEQMTKEMLLRIADLPQSDLPRVLEQTFPYIEFRELRAIPIAVLARQEDTPELYLRELTENRRILAELPVHVRRKILQVDRRELHLLVEECTREYVTDQLEWYLNHPTSRSTTVQRSLSRRNSNNSMRTGNLTRKRSLDESAGGSLWNVSSHVPSSAEATGSSPSLASGYSGERRPSYSMDERRRNNPALMKLVEMLGDSESLYLSTLEIWRGYVVAANIPGSATSNHPKEYVDYVSLLGAMRSDLANLQRDKTTLLLRTDPLHKFIWFLDRAMKNQTLEIAQLHELLGFIGRLRTSDLPPNKKFRKKGGAEEEEENFEVVLGPPPVDELIAVLDKIAKTDARLIFAEPVPDDVPKYRDIIKDPMDLSTMRKKAKRGKYKTLDAFVGDFNLMIRNCMAFNPDTTIFYKEGKRIGKRGNELIERNTGALRGEPQRIRTKKRRKTNIGPTSEALSMLTSSGVVTIKDFGDVDQSGMIHEGMCDELLADVALVLSDPLVKQLICDALMKNLVVCWQKKELPTDNLICRALVQLLQIGNPSSVRRMIRKQDFVLRAPQVVTMRVVLPLLLRTMVGFHVYYAFSTGLQDDLKTNAKDDVLDTMLWDNVLRASSAIRAMLKSFAVQCLVDHQIDAGSQLLHHLLSAEDGSLLRDRVLLHAVAEVVLEQVQLAAASTSTSNGSDGGSSSAENGEVTMTLSEQLQALAVWKQIFDGFFVGVLAKRIQTAKGSVVHFADDAIDSAEGEEHKRQHLVKSFPIPVFHEKTAMLLSSLVTMVEKSGSADGDTVMIASYLKKTLGVLRTSCSSVVEFEALWNSPVFAGCRQFYEPLLTKCPVMQKELFAVLASDVKMKVVNVQNRRIEPATTNYGIRDATPSVVVNALDTQTEKTAVQSEDGYVAAKAESSFGYNANAETNSCVDTKLAVKTENFDSATEADFRSTYSTVEATASVDHAEKTKDRVDSEVNMVSRDNSVVCISNANMDIGANLEESNDVRGHAESVTTAVEANVEDGGDTDININDVEQEVSTSIVEVEISSTHAGPKSPDSISKKAPPATRTGMSSSDSTAKAMSPNGEGVGAASGPADSNGKQKEAVEKTTCIKDQKDGNLETQTVVEEEREAVET